MQLSENSIQFSFCPLIEDLMEKEKLKFMLKIIENKVEQIKWIYYRDKN